MYNIRFFIKKFLNKILICSLVVASLFTPGCGNAPKQPDVSNVSFSVSKTDLEGYSYASRIGLDPQTLEDLLTIKENAKEYKLIPAVRNTSHEEYWKNLVTDNDDYIKTFFLNRKALTKVQAIVEFREAINVMWNDASPDELFFISTLNGNYAGIIKCSGLTSSETTIGYVTAKEYKGQNVATNALKMLVKLLKRLNENKFYSIEKTLLWIFDDNPASIAVAEKNGFTYDKQDAANNRARYKLNT